MTREEIIRMAREAGIDAVQSWKDPAPAVELIERFFQTAYAAGAAAEREACAKVCESMIVETLDNNEWVDATNDSKQRCAAAIRARGETK